MDNQKILSKIQKLLAKQQNNFKEEAESALLMAQKLMVKHGLSMADVEGVAEDNSNVVEESVYHSVAPRWHGKIAVILSRNFRCKCIWLQKLRNGRKTKMITFIGCAADAAIVKEAHIYAIALINYNIRSIKKRFPRVTTPYINTYIDGFIAGLNAKFKEQVNKEEWGLVLVTPAVVQAQYDSYNPVDTKPRGKVPEKSKNYNAYNQGYLDGKAFEHDRPRIDKKESVNY